MLRQNIFKEVLGQQFRFSKIQRKSRHNFLLGSGPGQVLASGTNKMMETREKDQDFYFIYISRAGAAAP